MALVKLVVVSVSSTLHVSPLCKGGDSKSNKEEEEGGREERGEDEEEAQPWMTCS
jgi:hypothetical protein